LTLLLTSVKKYINSGNSLVSSDRSQHMPLKDSDKPLMALCYVIGRS